ncbi:MAG: helix-turn-helix transcriptional regulator [Clostridia bacterium]|nr:helix-turn-helix transcriptional regulator [Clostridia bacterium]
MPYVEALKEIMKIHDLSQKELADILGVNQTTVSQWLLGRKKPGYDSIMAIYKNFDVDPNFLFGIDY